MRVRNAHSSAIDGHEPGALFDVDPGHPGFAPLLKAGHLIPATARDVRLGPNDPPPSPAAVRELIAGVNASHRAIEDLHAAVEELTRERDASVESARGLQQRVNELEALLALRPGAPTEGDAVREAEAALTARFDAAYAELQSKHDALASENAKLRADLEQLTAPAKPAENEASAPAEKPAPTKPRAPREG